MSALAPILQGFFTDKLIRQRQASPKLRRWWCLNSWFELGIQ